MFATNPYDRDDFLCLQTAFLGILIIVRIIVMIQRRGLLGSAKLKKASEPVPPRSE
jgi:hypothetical protein